MIVRKNWLNILSGLTLILGLIHPSIANAAPKAILVKSTVIWSEAVGVEAICITNKAVVTLKNLEQASTNIEVLARDFAGNLLWTKIIDSGVDEIATAMATDNQGNIWIVGNSSMVQPVETVTVSAETLNPDGVILETPTQLRPDMKNLTLWQLSAMGEVVAIYSTTLAEIALVDAISVNSTGISILGVRNTGHFVINVALNGIFGEELKIGTARTKLNAIVRGSDGTVNIFGSSMENLSGKKLVGRMDGVLIKITKNGLISSVVRSSAPQSTREWKSATSNLFLTGSVKFRKSTESAITKFTSSFVPTWTTRIASTGPTLSSIGPSNTFYAVLEPTGMIKGILDWQPIKGQSVVIQFDSKGAIVDAFTLAELAQVKVSGYSAAGGLFLLTENAIFKVGGAK